jgi:nucleoside-diphosphate-sugar epimerase
MMSHSEPPRTIVVVGATGNQGGGVVRSLLKSTTALWHVRALTRDPSSTRSQSFLSANQTSDNRLTLVSGHVYDKSSLVSAFTGAYGVFAVTSERYPFKKLEKEEEMKHEIEAGRNLVEAAKECNVKHFVFSTLPDMVKTIGGRFPRIHHMNNKHAIEQMARRELDGYTGLIPGKKVTSCKILWCSY